MNLKPNDLINTYRLRHKNFILRYWGMFVRIFYFTKLHEALGVLVRGACVYCIKAPHSKLLFHRSIFWTFACRRRSYFIHIFHNYKREFYCEALINIFAICTDLIGAVFLNEKLNGFEFHWDLPVVYFFRPRRIQKKANTIKKDFFIVLNKKRFFFANLKNYFGFCSH